MANSAALLELIPKCKDSNMSELIVGCDEVGYGCLAGPLVVCGVRAPMGWNMLGLNDSKKLSPKRRGEMLLKLMLAVKNGEIHYHLAQRSNHVIDQQGVAVALKDAYVEVMVALHQPGCLIICDGILKFDKLVPSGYNVSSVIKADTKIPAVMAASIIAKEYRDDDMHQLHHRYPDYGWNKNVGYGSKVHLQAIEKYGPTPLHRMSYAPMRNKHA
jgi:ribonuclease HII